VVRRVQSGEKSRRVYSFRKYLVTTIYAPKLALCNGFIGREVMLFNNVMYNKRMCNKEWPLHPCTT